MGVVSYMWLIILLVIIYIGEKEQPHAYFVKTCESCDIPKELGDVI